MARTLVHGRVSWLLVLIAAMILGASTAVACKKTSQSVLSFSLFFGGAGNDEGHSVQQTSDGGYIIAGVNASHGTPRGDVWLLKTDRFGNGVWDRTFGEADHHDVGYSVIQTSDSGYVIAGFTDSYDSGGTGIWLVKTNASGDKLWDKIFGGMRAEEGQFVQQTSDGGYILTGWTTGRYDVVLIRTDASGEKVWERTFGGNRWDGGHSVRQTSDGGYIIAGATFSFGAGAGDVWLIKTDTSGNMVWNRTFGGNRYDGGYSVQQTSDGGYIVAGQTASRGAGGDDLWLIKTDSLGNNVWDKTVGASLNDRGRCVRQTFDGGYIVAGYSESYSVSFNDFWLVKTDTSGNKVWDRTYGGKDPDVGRSVQQTFDGGYIVVGTTYSYGAGLGDIWLIKTDADGD